MVPPASIAALGVAKANPSEKLVLVGTVGPAELPVDTTWSLASGGLASGEPCVIGDDPAHRVTSRSVGVMDQIISIAIGVNPPAQLTLRAHRTVARASRGATVGTMYLVLPAGSLTDGGYYQIRALRAVRPGQRRGERTPGLLGALRPDERAAVVGQDRRHGARRRADRRRAAGPYDLACSGWVDDVSDLPLLFSFYYSIFGAATEYQLVSNALSDSYHNALLPRGGGNASEVICIGYVADVYAAASRTTAVATVLPMSVSVSDLANITARLFSDAFDTGNVEAAFQAMVATSSVLNAANCSVPCAGELNRASCEVSGLCGNCLDGFVGTNGPSNQPCGIASAHCENGIVDGNETDLDCGGPSCAPCAFVGASCALDTDCAYSWCSPANTCMVPVKPCPNNCTMGQGTCSHIDVTGARLAARDCLAADWACSAVCVCGVGWHGDDCSLDEPAYAQVVELRSSLLGHLSTATSMQDVSAASLNQQASSLSSIAADPSELARGGELRALSLVGGIAASSEEIGLANGTSGTVGDTISSLLSSDLLTTNATAKKIPTTAPTADAPTTAPTADAPTAGPTLADGAALGAVIDAISALSAAQLNGAVAGESATMLSTENVMMASSRAFASNEADELAPPPANAGGSAPVVSLGAVSVAFENGTAAPSDLTVDTLVQQWGYNVYAGSDAAGTATASSLISLGISTDELGDGGERRRRRLTLVARGEPTADTDGSPLTLVLHNVRPVEYSAGASNDVVNLTCPPGFVGRVSAECPGTNASVSVNCTGRYPALHPTTGAIVSFSPSWSTQMRCSTTVEPSCLMWNAALQSYDSEVCSPVNWTATNTTCACSADALAVASGGRGASFTSGSEALAGSFVAMFDGSSFGPNLFLQNALLLWTFGVIFALSLLNMVVGIRNDRRDRAATWTTLEVAKARRATTCSPPPDTDDASGEVVLAALRAETGVAETEIMSASIEKTRSFANYAETSLPAFVDDRSLL